MLQTQSKPHSSNGVTPETDAQANFVKNLEELNKWQEQQKKLLDLKQTVQRQMLGIEQQALYETLGLQQNDSNMTLVEVDRNADRSENFACQETERLVEYTEESTEKSIETSQIEEEILEDDANKEAASYAPLTTCWDTERCEETSRAKPKRPFLKRGEGLKQRFKIDPDEFRLNKLPKYKYANAHPNLRFKPLKKSNKTTTDLKTKPANLPASKAKTADELANLDAQELRFHNLLISSKNSCSSTPETKPAFLINKIAASLENNPLARCEKKSIQNHEAALTAKLNEAKSKPVITQMLAWSKILDPLEIEPLQVPRNSKQSLPQSEESIFELLEKKAEEGSFDMESTCLKEFMTRRINEKLNESDDIIPVNDQLKNQRLEPVASAESLPQDHFYCSSDELDSSTSDETTHKTVETSSTPNQRMPGVRVRFSNSNETHEYEEEPDEAGRLSAGSWQPEGQGDTNQSDLFVQFKQALFAALQVKADQHLANDSTVASVGDTTLTDKNFSSNSDISSSVYSPFCKELQEKTDMIKTRLAELEKEIKFFKENNLLLLKAKQEHELQKSLNAQEHLEAMESLKDEKIRMEIYLHDERMKLEDEKRQFELNVKMKTQGSIAKERKECDRLKEQVNQLEVQLKTKETNHTAAQARLRTQIRNLEREQSKLHEQLENMARENKKLENENLKISREQNNKILLEINRNIAKLAPKQAQQTAFPIPDEGPPTLAASRTVSKSVVASATNNIKNGKPNKTLSARSSNVQQQANHKISADGKDKETEPAPQTNFGQADKQHQHTQIKDNMNLGEQTEEEDDVVKELQLTPEKRRKTLSKTEGHNSSCSQKPIPESRQNQVPMPPPSSPRACGGANMKREIVNADGSRDVWYPNGNLKKISADGMIIRMLYYNKDIKETNINEGTVKYYYAETNTWHTSYLDGLEILEFPNGQVEHRHKNGIVEVHYPNNSVKIVNPNDEHKQEEWRFTDGTHLIQMRNGDKILSLPNGQKEIHNKLHKRREYPDGTVKIVYPDGSTETRYSNGRVRLKDVEGKLVMDTDMAK